MKQAITMKNKNTYTRRSGEMVLWIALLSSAIATKGLSITYNPRNDTSQELTKSSEEGKVNDNNRKYYDINLGSDDDKQTKVYESLIVDINELERALERTRKELEDKVAYQIRCNENAINSINTSISGASYALVIFTIVVMVGGILLGFYITLVERKVRNLTNENKSILDTHLKIKEDVERLNKNINKNMAELYDKLKREETNALVARLVQVPEDITNLFSNLASREIHSELYPEFKKAYQNVKGDQRSGFLRGSYLTLFFQHFPALAFFDEDLRNEMESHYAASMDNAFKNDIIKTSCEFLSACMGSGILNCRDRIKKYFIALSISQHKDLLELHAEVYRTLSTKENRFNFYSILRPESELEATSKVYGQYILSDYKDVSGNTESEKLVLSEIAQEVEQKDQ